MAYPDDPGFGDDDSGMFDSGIAEWEAGLGPTWSFTTNGPVFTGPDAGPQFYPGPDGSQENEWSAGLSNGWTAQVQVIAVQTPAGWGDDDPTMFDVSISDWEHGFRPLVWVFSTNGPVFYTPGGDPGFENPDDGTSRTVFSAGLSNGWSVAVQVVASPTQAGWGDQDSGPFTDQVSAWTAGFNATYDTGTDGPVFTDGVNDPGFAAPPTGAQSVSFAFALDNGWTANYQCWAKQHPQGWGDTDQAAIDAMDEQMATWLQDYPGDEGYEQSTSGPAFIEPGADFPYNAPPFADATMTIQTGLSNGWVVCFRVSVVKIGNLGPALVDNNNDPASDPSSWGVVPDTGNGADADVSYSRIYSDDSGSLWKGSNGDAADFQWLDFNSSVLSLVDAFSDPWW